MFDTYTILARRYFYCRKTDVTLGDVVFHLCNQKNWRVGQPSDNIDNMMITFSTMLFYR